MPTEAATHSRKQLSSFTLSLLGSGHWKGWSSLHQGLPECVALSLQSLGELSSDFNCRRPGKAQNVTFPERDCKSAFPGFNERDWLETSVVLLKEHGELHGPLMPKAILGGNCFIVPVMSINPGT